MIDFLRSWVFNIVTLVILIAILEILLPSGKLKKFINFVSGFILIIAIINPVLGLIKGGVDLKDFQISSSNYLDEREIAANSKLMKEEQMQQVVEVYRKKLIARLEEGLKGTGGFDGVKADVLIDEDYTAETFGEIKRVYLTLQSKASPTDIKPVSKVEKIRIGDKEKKEEAPDNIPGNEIDREIKNKLEEKVGRLLEVKPENIVIKVQAG